MPEEPIDTERILDALRQRVLDLGEEITKIVAGRYVLRVRTPRRSLMVSRPQWWVRGEAWVDDAFEIVGPEPMTHTEPEIFGLIWAKDGSSYALGLYGGDDLEALASRLVLPGDRAIGAKALAELVALHRVGGYYHGTLVEGSVWGKPLLERYPEADAVTASVYPVRETREGDRVRVEFCSYTRRPVDLRVLVTVEQWSVETAPGTLARIERQEIADLEV